MTSPVETTNGATRRDFLKVLGVAGAATTMVGCSTDKVEKLIPYVTSPDNTVPGVSAITPPPAANARPGAACSSRPATAGPSRRKATPTIR